MQSLCSYSQALRDNDGERNNFLVKPQEQGK